MTLRQFLPLASMLAFIFGLGFTLFGAPLTALYNVTLDPAGVFMGQLLGAALIGFGVLNWQARTLTDAPALSMIRLANLISSAIGFIVALLAQLTRVGGVNQLGWSTVAIYLLLTLGFAYFHFVKPAVIK